MTGSDSADDSADNLKLVAFSLCFCILQAIKKWRRRRPGNEATSSTVSRHSGAETKIEVFMLQIGGRG